MNSYDAGDSLRLLGTFTNVAGVLTAPTTVALHIIPPNQPYAVIPGTTQYTLAQGSLTAAAAGSYYRDLLPIPAGTYGVWRYSYVGSGDVNAVFVGEFNVYQGPRS